MSHRKVDVDALVGDDYDEDVQTTQTQTLSLPQLMAIVDQKTAEIQSHLQRGSAANALAVGLENPVYGDADVAPAKDKYTRAIIDVLASVRSADIPTVLKSLTNPNVVDSLLKYVYKGMAKPELYSSSVLLAWHEKIIEVAGVGSIMRVMSDRQVV